MGRGENSLKATDAIDMELSPEVLVARVIKLYAKISKLNSLKPSKRVNTLFGQLVRLCSRPNSIDVRSLDESVQETRSRLICLCGEAEGLLESHFAEILGRLPQPLVQMYVFPYYSNYWKLALMEYKMLCENEIPVAKKLAFVGSGPLPFTSILLALHHLPSTAFHNYDVDPSANAMAGNLVAAHPDLSKRMTFHTCNILKVTEDLAEYDVVFLAALVGMDKAQKIEVLQHLAKHMLPGSVLLLRSAHGARGFLYPVVDEEDLSGFQVVSVIHPTDEVINSVILARKST
eukprot:Gb_05072 [translate_table: standard]